MYFAIRRVVDTLISLVVLVILSPVLLIISLAIVIDSKGGVIFKQKRIGKNGKPYSMYKFRTMVPNAQNMGTGVYSFADDPRITRVGRFLRKTSLDELLQLFNVIKGDMAIIGPRSPVLGHFPEYETLSEDYKRRFSVLPGITGLAQVTGRNELLWDEKVKYDNIYIDKVKKYGPLYDIKILFLTVGRVFSMNDVSETRENMEKNEAMKNGQQKETANTTDEERV
jgi:lipopolysaccharide/colanic/teichoic acid biosynthesis glycosyltransferase